MSGRRRRTTVRAAAAAVALCILSTLCAAALGPLVGRNDVAGASDAFPTIDGLFSGTGSIGPLGTLELTVVGRGGVPDTGVRAVALDVTATDPTSASFVTVWPTGAPRPLAASLTMVRGQTTSNMVVVGVGARGSVSLFNYAGAVDVVVDVLGWFPDAASAGGFVPVTPARMQDTRAGQPTIDGRFAGAGAMHGGESRSLAVVGRGGVPASGVAAVALDVTVTGPTSASFLTVWPAGTTRPVAASLTMDAGESASNLVIVGVGAGGAVALFDFAGAVDVIVDVVGWFPAAGPGAGYVPVTPARVQDTRNGEPTVDGLAAGAGALGPGSTTDLRVVGRGGVPAAGVGAVVLNVSVTNPTSGSFVTVWPAGTPRPLAASLTMAPGETTSNLVIAGVGASGDVSIFAYAGSVDVVVDVLGWFPDAAGGGFASLTPARLADTRVPRPAMPLPTYPNGRCDMIAPGMDGLALRQREVPDAVEEIGRSMLGRSIWAEYYGPPDPTSTVLVIGQVHGNECAPSRLVHAIRAMDRRAYGVWLIPTLNPDGYAAYTRANARGKDLNTDGATWSQPETVALIAFTARVRPALTIHVHSPNGTVGGFGTAPYLGGDPATSPAPLAGVVARYVVEHSALVLDPELARPDRARWFLWQGLPLADPGVESVLVELHAVANAEVPTAVPRPPTQTVAAVDGEAALVIQALDAVLGS